MANLSFSAALPKSSSNARSPSRPCKTVGGVGKLPLPRRAVSLARRSLGEGGQSALFGRRTRDRRSLRRRLAPHSRLADLRQLRARRRCRTWPWAASTSWSRCRSRGKGWRRRCRRSNCGRWGGCRRRRCSSCRCWRCGSCRCWRRRVSSCWCRRECCRCSSRGCSC